MSRQDEGYAGFRSFWKQPRARTVVRAVKREARTKDETAEKRKVRARDRTCRFPHCGCRRMGLRLHVAHVRHKGAGGNPKGDRSTAAGMLLLCGARHRENGVSLDRGTVRVRPLDPRQGLAGPCAFDVDVRALSPSGPAGPPSWVEVGRETALHVFDLFTPEQLGILEALRSMLL